MIVDAAAIAFWLVSLLIVGLGAWALAALGAPAIGAILVSAIIFVGGFAIMSAVR